MHHGILEEHQVHARPTDELVVLPHVTEQLVCKDTQRWDLRGRVRRKGRVGEGRLGEGRVGRGVRGEGREEGGGGEVGRGEDGEVGRVREERVGEGKVREVFQPAQH